MIRYEPKLKDLNYYLVSSYHSDYFTKYKETFQGLRELSDRHDRGLREGVVKLKDDVYIGFTSQPDSRYSYVIGFAPSEADLKPYLLNTSQGKVFIANFDYELVPHEIKGAPAIIFFNDNILQEFQDDVQGFLQDGDYYKDKKEEYKRGAMFFGPPGNGKTITTAWAATQFDKVFVVPPDCAAPEVARNINLMCDKDESKLIVIEDVESVDERNSDLLNFVDGAVYVNKSYYIATTNYPEKLHENILDRPSRFDLFVEISRPNLETRERLLRYHLPDLTDREYKEYAEKSEGLNASYFKEIRTLKHRSQITGKELTFDQIIEKCKMRVNLAQRKNFKSNDSGSKVGFASGPSPRVR